MAVTDYWPNAVNHGGTVEGKKRSTALSSYTTSHIIKVDDAVPDAKTVLTFCRNTPGTPVSLPYPGRGYRVAGVRDRNSKCRRVEVRYIPDSDGLFQVDGFYTEYDLPTDEIDVSFTQINTPIEKAVFRGAENAGKLSPHLKLNQECQLVNSNGAANDPTIEHEQDIKVIRITKVVDRYDDGLFRNFHGAVNTDYVTIDRSDLKFRTSFNRWLGRVKVIGGTMFLDEDEDIRWRQTIEIHINPLGWRRKVLDQGTHTALWKGEVAGEGVAGVAAGQRSTSATPVLTRAKDLDGYPVTTPIMLDDNGKELDIARKDPVYLVWSVYKELPLMLLKNRAW